MAKVSDDPISAHGQRTVAAETESVSLGPAVIQTVAVRDMDIKSRLSPAVNHAPLVYISPGRSILRLCFNNLFVPSTELPRHEFARYGTS